MNDSNAPLLKCVTVNPPIEARACVIWMHGLGADPDDFVGMIDQLGLPSKHNVRFVFPQAPLRAITINGGMMMPGWYDILSLSIARPEDEFGIRTTQTSINELIREQQASGIASHRIILGGFSQGGAMSLFVGLRYPEALAGIIALSCYQLLPDRFTEERHSNNQKTPIFMAHGLFDTMVPYALCQEATHQLLGGGYHVETRSYPMQHTLVQDEIVHIAEFMQKVLGAGDV